MMTTAAPSAAEQALARKGYRKEIPAALLTQLTALEQKDNWHNIFSIAEDWLTIAAAIAVTYAVHLQIMVYVLAVIIIGSRQRGLMNLLHEASHRKLFRNQLANNWVGRLLTAYPLLASFTAYRSTHAIHHGFLWDVTRDPKTQRYQTLGLVAPPQDGATFVWRHILRPLLLLFVAFNIKSTLSLKDERKEESPLRYGFIALMMLAFVLTHQFQGLLLFWLVPYCTTFQIIRYWNEMAEHAGLFEYNAWMATRNWRSTWWMEGLLAPHHDDLFHLTHHLFPLIPHYRLAAAHHLLMQMPQYAQAHQCNGFFWQRRAGAPSVLQDIRRPHDIATYTVASGVGAAMQTGEIASPAHHETRGR